VPTIRNLGTSGRDEDDRETTGPFAPEWQKKRSWQNFKSASML
jgi:hypothetical protein